LIRWQPFRSAAPRRHDPLDRREIVARNRGRMREVEPQPVGRHERPGLLDVRAERAAQRRVQQVRRRMVPPDGVATRHINGCGHADARRERPRLHRHRVRAGAARRQARHAGDLGLDAGGVEPPFVRPGRQTRRRRASPPVRQSLCRLRPRIHLTLRVEHGRWPVVGVVECSLETIPDAEQPRLFGR
jgi:hypothetical protein